MPLAQTKTQVKLIGLLIFLFSFAFVVHSNHTVADVFEYTASDDQHECFICSQSLDNPPENLLCPYTSQIECFFTCEEVKSALVKREQYRVPPLRAPPQ